MSITVNFTTAERDRIQALADEVLGLGSTAGAGARIYEGSRVRSRL